MGKEKKKSKLELEFEELKKIKQTENKLFLTGILKLNIMKTKSLFSTLLIVLVMSLQSCAAIEGIFKAGAATGIIAVVIVLALVIFLITRFRGNNKP